MSHRWIYFVLVLFVISLYELIAGTLLKFIVTREITNKSIICSFLVAGECIAFFRIYPINSEFAAFFIKVVYAWNVLVVVITTVSMTANTVAANKGTNSNGEGQ